MYKLYIIIYLSQNCMLDLQSSNDLTGLPPGGRWPAGYIGDGGGWVPGGEPPKNAQPPAVARSRLANSWGMTMDQFASIDKTRHHNN